MEHAHELARPPDDAADLLATRKEHRDQIRDSVEAARLTRRRPRPQPFGSGKKSFPAEGMAPEASFAECHELIEEMRRIYATDEDALKVRALNQQFKEVRKLCEDREAHMQTVIEEMVKRVADGEEGDPVESLPNIEASRRSRRRSAPRASFSPTWRLGFG